MYPGFLIAQSSLTRRMINRAQIHDHMKALHNTCLQLSSRPESSCTTSASTTHFPLSALPFSRNARVRNTEGSSAWMLCMMRKS
jgi:hypothetical protein